MGNLCTTIFKNARYSVNENVYPNKKHPFRFINQLKMYVSVLLLLLTAFSEAKAQCSVVGLNNSGETVTIQISCSFPVWIDTGDQLVNSQMFDAEKAAWIENFPNDYASLNALHEFLYYQVHQDDLNVMPDARKSAILANPNLYHVVQ